MVSIITVLLLFSGIQAEEGPPDRETLRGIKRIGIKIGEISSAAKAVWVERKFLGRNIPLKLQSKGMSVVGNNELEANREIPYLLVTLLLSYINPPIVML